jgi:hypothetical protein
MKSGCKWTECDKCPLNDYIQHIWPGYDRKCVMDLIKKQWGSEKPVITPKMKY